MDEGPRRVAENEVLFRQVNERVVAGGRRPAETFEIVCECANTDCMEHLWVTTELYERARREPTDFCSSQVTRSWNSKRSSKGTRSSSLSARSVRPHPSRGNSAAARDP